MLREREESTRREESDEDDEEGGLVEDEEEGEDGGDERGDGALEEKCQQPGAEPHDVVQAGHQQCFLRWSSEPRGT